MCVKCATEIRIAIYFTGARKLVSDAIADLLPLNINALARMPHVHSSSIQIKICEKMKPHTATGKTGCNYKTMDRPTSYLEQTNYY
jgi:hypothetical protein